MCEFDPRERIRQALKFLIYFIPVQHISNYQSVPGAFPTGAPPARTKATGGYGRPANRDQQFATDHAIRKTNTSQAKQKIGKLKHNYPAVIVSSG